MPLPRAHPKGGRVGNGSIGINGPVTPTPHPDLDDRPAARALLNLARRHRVEALKLQGQLAAPETEYTPRFDLV